jgi:membrane protein YqaA with SNARE-associated domain
MIIKLLIILGFIVFFEQNAAPITSRLTYSLIGILIIQKTNIILLSSIIITCSVSASIITRLLYWPLESKIQNYQQKHNNKDRISKIQQLLSKYITKQKKLSKINSRLKNYTQTRKGKFMLFLCSIATLASIIPDVFTIWVTRNKLNLFQYTIAAILGKCLAYLPVILIEKSIFKIFDM